MNIISQAQEFIENGGNLITLLKKCIEDYSLQALTAIQLLYEDMHGGYTYNYEIKAFSAYCLILWGNSGIDALVESAKKTNKSKNTSIALQILSSLAAGEVCSPIIRFIGDIEIRKKIVKTINSNKDIYDYARKKLNEYILSFTFDDDAAFAVGLCLMNYSHTLGINALKHLFAALAIRWSAISAPIIEQYDELLEHNSQDEKVFQQFFESFPQFLDPMVLEVWSKPNFHGFKIPDFVIRRTDNSYVIVEIEKPAKLLVTNNNRISAEVSEAVSQVMQYRTFLMERFSEAIKHFPHFQDPDALVVIGLERNLNEEQKKVLLMENQHRSKLKIVGFDWLKDRALAIYNNMIRNRIELNKLRMT